MHHSWVAKAPRWATHTVACPNSSQNRGYKHTKQESRSLKCCNFHVWCPIGPNFLFLESLREGQHYKKRKSEDGVSYNSTKFKYIARHDIPVRISHAHTRFFRPRRIVLRWRPHTIYHGRDLDDCVYGEATNNGGTAHNLGVHPITLLVLTNEKYQL